MGMRKKRNIGLTGLAVFLVTLVVIACGGDVNERAVGPLSTSVPTEEPTSAPEIAPTATATPRPTTHAINTPVSQSQPPVVPAKMPTPTTEPSPTPVSQTIINEYGFKLELDGEISVETAGSPTSEQGMLRFTNQGVTAILGWEPSINTPQQVVANSYKRLQDGQPDLHFESISEGALPVSGERGVFGGFRVLDKANSTVGGGLVAAWVCSESQSLYSLTLTGSQATVEQLRFQRIVRSFTCAS